MEGYNWEQIFLFFFLYCFLGWVFESTYVSVMERKLTSRGFLRGPVIPIYGFGAMIIVFATTPFRGNYLAEYVAGAVAATLFELLVGMTMEAIFKVKYWDYSHKPFQYKGYICLESSLCWGLLSVVAAEVLQVRLEWLVFQLPQTLTLLLASMVTIVFSIDTVFSVRDAWGLRNVIMALEKVKCDLEQLQQEVEAHSEEFVQLLEARIQAKKEELEQHNQERRAQLEQEVFQLRTAIEVEKQERELARARLSARIERDVVALKTRLRQEKTEFYEKLQEAWTEQETHKVGQLDRGNLLLKDLESKERQLWERLQRQGGILHRNPNTTSRELGNLRNYAEQQIKRKNSN